MRRFSIGIRSHLLSTPIADGLLWTQPKPVGERVNSRKTAIPQLLDRETGARLTLEDPGMICPDGLNGSGCIADQTFPRHCGVSKLVFRFKKPSCATALLGGQLRIAGKLKDRLGKPSTIAVADDEPGLAVSYYTGQFALMMTDKNSRAASSCDALIFALVKVNLRGLIVLR